MTANDPSYEDAQTKALARKLRIHYLALIAEGFTTGEAQAAAIQLVGQQR